MGNLKSSHGLEGKEETCPPITDAKLGPGCSGKAAVGAYFPAL